MVDIWNYITEFLSGIAGFWSWLISPINELGGWRPISIIGIGGLTTVLIFWVIKLINPLS